MGGGHLICVQYIFAAAAFCIGLVYLVHLRHQLKRVRRAEDALRRSEAKYRDLFENANDAIFIVDSEHRYIDANKKALELLGYSRDELLSLGILDLIPPEQRPRSEMEFHKLQERGSYETFTGKVRTRDGRWLDVEVSSSAIVEGGRIAGSRDIMRNVTERKRLDEDALRSQKLESLAVLAGGIAHDFNNLLTSIMGNVSLALLDVDPAGEVHHELLRAEKAALRARDLTQQLLTFSKGGEPVKKPVVLEGLIRDTVGFALRGSRVRAEFEVCDALWPVEADEGQISQVISNIVINADQAMPSGGLLRVACDNVTLAAGDIVPLPAGRYVRIAIADQGIGIPRESIRKIFDPYFTTKQKGSGLGLATSYSIIKRHGGHIAVESELGAGSLFSIYLPALEGAVVRAPEEQRGIVAGSGRMLIMDDEEMVREVAAGMLRKAGYEVVTVNDGAAAVEAFQDALSQGRRFDAVIMDVTVPGGMGGEEALVRLRELDPAVTAIVSSGYANDAVMARFADYGFAAVVMKPYTADKLSAAVHEALQGKK